MQAYEFSTKVTSDGKLIIPNPYIQNMRKGDSVRVIVLVDEPLVDNEREEQLIFRLEHIVAEIKAKPQNPNNIKPASGLLAKHLADLPHKYDPSFDVIAWNKEWDKIEAEMKVMEIAEEQAEAHI